MDKDSSPQLVLKTHFSDKSKIKPYTYSFLKDKRQRHKRISVIKIFENNPDLFYLLGESS